MQSGHERLFELDLVRLAATLAVVMIHVSSGYLPGGSGGYFLNQLSRFAVPLFFAVSGASLLAAYGPELKPGPFYRGRLRKVLVPYVLWTGFYLLASYHFSPGAMAEPAFWQDFAKYLFLGIDHLYFIVIIMQLYLLYPLLLKLYHRPGSRLLLTGTLALSLGTQTIVYLMRWNVLVFPAGFSAYLYLLFPAWVFFMVLGMAYVEMAGAGPRQAGGHSQAGSQYPPRGQGTGTLAASGLPGASWPALSLKGWGLLAGLAFGVVLTDSLLTNTYGSSIKPSAMLYASVSLPFLWQLGGVIKATASPRLLDALSFLSRQSFFLFFAHVEVMRVLRKVGDEYIMAGLWEHVYGLLALYLVTVAATAALACVVSRWRHAWLLGADPHPSRLTV